MFDGNLSSIRVNNTNLSEMDVEDVSKHEDDRPKLANN